MGKHTKRDTPAKPESQDAPSRGSGRGWLAPEDVQAAQDEIDRVNRQNVLDAAAQIHARRYHHGG